MKKYSITKYSRNNQNIKEEWTSISDIGKIYADGELNKENYIQVEDAYVNSILEIINYMNIETVKIKNIFKWKNLRDEIKENIVLEELYTQSMLNFYENLNVDSIINKDALSNLIRLELREDIGGLLYVPYRLKIFIGYDYMMGVHSSISLDDIFENIFKLGLNIYQFP